LENGQHFRKPCFGCSEFPVQQLTLVEAFDLDAVSSEIVSMGDVDLGYMLYKMHFQDSGVPINGNWDAPKFSDRAKAVYYRPHMINGVIQVSDYTEGLRC
jgi:CRISPR-associated protein Cas5d